jgi:hypothetical protein
VLAPNNETWLNYVAEPSHLRGSFRFVTITLARGSYIELCNLTSYYTAAPSIKDDELQNYSGWCKILPLWTRCLFYLTKMFSLLFGRPAQSGLVRWRTHTSAMHYWQGIE